LPDGVFNVVNGDKEAVDALLAHPDVQAVSFVGSTPIAKYIFSTGTAHGKRVQALGGAKNHAVSCRTPIPRWPPTRSSGAAYGSAGERCMAISVAVFVGDKIADDVLDRVRDKIKVMKVGASDDKNAEMGPLVTGAHRDKVKGLHRQRRRRGCGARRRRPRAQSVRTRGRLFRRAHAVRSRGAAHENLQGRDLRSGAVVAPCGHL
jgi:malonate-semialdehyde dehydrogenase (acetylating)/methylmalonate-semialdehyde dehydrogenase